MAIKQKYVSIKRLLNLNWEYAMLLGERSNGKSYACKEYVLKRYKETGERFIYLRRFQLETKPSYVEGYFKDAPVRQIFDDYDSIVAYRGGIYLARYDEKTGKTVRGDLVGYTAHLANEVHFKSQNYNDVTTVLFEEFITSEGYLYRECEKLSSFVSTVARRRRIKVFLIGNTISRLCPYFSEWGLHNIPRQKQGTIETYEHHTDQVDEDGNPVTVRIAVYFCENSASNSKMFFGVSNEMVTKGTWQTRAYPHLPYRYRECNSLYYMLYHYKEFIFKIEVLRTPDRSHVLFVHPHNKLEDVRTVSDTVDPRPYVTVDFRPVNKGDKVIQLLWKDGKVFYSDNLTGSDLESIIADKGGL